MHCVAIYLWNHQGEDAFTMASTIYESHPRALLAECWPDASPSLFATLKRCGRKIMPMEQYQQLNTLLGSSAADNVLQTNSLDGERIEFFFNALELDPLVASACRLLGFSRIHAQSFNDILKIMRETNLIWDFESESKTLRKNEHGSINDYIFSRFERSRSPINLNLLNPLRQILTAQELSSIAVKWQNCLRNASYKIDLALGTKIFILLEEVEITAIASFTKTANSLHMDECSLPFNKQTSPSIRQYIVDLLRQQGVAAETTTFSRALRELRPLCKPASIDDELCEILDTIAVEMADPQ
jgi:hypothetical protein